MSVSARNVSAVIVTRGDVDLSTILHSLPFDDVVVWDNSTRPDDLSCYGRFKAVEEAKHELIYFQDDDLLVPIPGLLRAYERRADRGSIVCNIRPDEEWLIFACGCLAHRDLIEGSFDEYVRRYGADEDFHRVCDVVWAYQHPFRRIWLGYLDFPWQTADNRMYKQADHYTVRERARDRVKALMIEEEET